MHLRAGGNVQKLPKMADFFAFFVLTGGASGGRASDWGRQMPPYSTFVLPLQVMCKSFACAVSASKVSQIQPLISNK